MKETWKEELFWLEFLFCRVIHPPLPPPPKKKKKKEIISKIVFLSLVVKTWKEGKGIC